MTSLLYKKYQKWLPAWVVMTTIFVLSSVPGSVIQSYGLGKETYHVNGHFIMFFLLFFCFFKAIKSIELSLFCTIIYALLDEIHQYFVPLRSVSSKDIFVDTLAALVAAFFVWKLLPLLPKKLSNWLYN